jgi:flagellar hook-length control protein FliK
MPQVQNLLDLFQKSRDAQVPSGADAKTAPKKQPGLNPAGKTDRNANSLLPVNPGEAGIGNTHVSQPKSSFQAKMEKSAAKLHAKQATSKATAPQGRTTAQEAARAPKAEPETSASRNDAPKQGHAAHAARDGRPAHARVQAHLAAPAKDDADQDQAAQDIDAGEQPASDASVAKPDASGQDDQTQGLDEKSRAAIKQGLADLGIQVDDKQLQDPAFLRDILRMLQTVPVEVLPDDNTQNADTDGTEAESVDATAVVAAPEAPASGDAQPQSAAVPAPAPAPISTSTPAAESAVQAPKPAPEVTPALPEDKPKSENPNTLTRQDLARLLESRIGGLERAAESQSGRIQVSAQAPTVTPKEWQGVQARPQAEGPSPDPLPLADLDRIRVMQASAMQAAPAKAEAAGPRTNLVLESDSVEPASGTAPMGRAEAGRDASGTQNQDAQTDLFGQSGEQTAGAQALPGKEGAASAKDGAAGSQFNQVLNQVRAVEHRAAPTAAAEPRAPLHDASVLDQIARKMSVIAHKSGDEINIQLTPENLGKVRVSLEMKADGMSARIAVENESVRKQVEDNLSSLKDALKDQGIRLQGMEVSVDQRHASLFNPDGSNADSFFRRQGGGDGREDNGPAADAAASENAPESDTGRRWGYNTREYIG